MTRSDPGAPAAEWSVLIKAARGADDLPVARHELEALLALLPGTDKGFTGGGRDLTVSFWIVADDAAEATAAGWAAVEAARQRLGLAPWTPIRTHAASAGQRLTGYLGVHHRVDDDRAWSILLKAERPPDGSDRASGAELAADGPAIAAALGPDAAVSATDSSVVARFWVSATDAAEASRVAGIAMSRALDSHHQDGWSVSRAHHAVARERAEDVYRGAAARAGANERAA